MACFTASTRSVSTTLTSFNASSISFSRVDPSLSLTLSLGADETGPWGVGAFPLGEAAEIMVREARAYEPASLQRVVFAVYGREAESAFAGALEAT